MPSRADATGGADVARSVAPASPPRCRWFEFCKLSLGYWKGETSREAWTLTFIMALFAGLQLSAQIGANAWGRFFFDALEGRKISSLKESVILLAALALFSGFAISGALVARMRMQLSWRKWVTEKLFGWWLEDQRYYRLEISSEEQTSPEYRIAKDVQFAVEPLVDFAIGLLTAAATAATFIGILWSVGGSLQFAAFGASYSVPGYLALSSVVYMAIATSATLGVGRSMIGAVAKKNETDAKFLAELMRIKENAESIALIRGDADEHGSLRANFANVVSACLTQIRSNGIVVTVQSANGALVPLIPLVLASPKYLSGELSLGAVMQVASAFISVQVALNWFMDNFVRVAEWMASAQRVDELVESLQSLDIAAIMSEGNFIEFGESDDNGIHLERLGVAHRGGQIVIAAANVLIAAGEKVLVRGASGTGKSTLIRALAGLWPWGAGRILMPRNASVAFVPQQPYIPLGTLRGALMYSVGANVTDDMIERAMRRCGLGYLIRDLDKDQRWDQVLSGGERQRIAFARLLLQSPEIIVMDEATSALDEESQISLLRLFHEELRYATVISVGHRAGMEEFHDKKILLERRPAGARLTSRTLEKPVWHLLGEQMRA
ncbi:MAG TPA: ABC transporter ATP-binding protein/permease [Methylocystis sp.]|nr:ABC transporter ATP-binding protein/permease [Methylocystis sp.]